MATHISPVSSAQNVAAACVKEPPPVNRPSNRSDLVRTHSAASCWPCSNRALAIVSPVHTWVLSSLITASNRAPSILVLGGRDSPKESLVFAAGRLLEKRKGNETKRRARIRNRCEIQTEGRPFRPFFVSVDGTVAWWRRRRSMTATRRRPPFRRHPPTGPARPPPLRTARSHFLLPPPCVNASGRRASGSPAFRRRDASEHVERPGPILLRTNDARGPGPKDLTGTQR